jgi:hypothetical protein
MSFAIIRGGNGRRHEVDFGDDLDRLPRSGGVGSEHHAAARMSIPSMPARASAGVR